MVVMHFRLPHIGAGLGAIALLNAARRRRPTSLPLPLCYRYDIRPIKRPTKLAVSLERLD